MLSLRKKRGACHPAKGSESELQEWTQQKLEVTKRRTELQSSLHQGSFDGGESLRIVKDGGLLAEGKPGVSTYQIEVSVPTALKSFQMETMLHKSINKMTVGTPPMLIPISYLRKYRKSGGCIQAIGFWTGGR